MAFSAAAAVIPKGVPSVVGLRFTSKTPTREELKAKVLQEVSANPVVIFSKTSCPFCSMAKEELQKLGVEAATFELDLGDQEYAAQLQTVLGDITGARSVPRVFIGGKFFGGGDETVAAARTGELKRLVDAALAK